MTSFFSQGTLFRVELHASLLHFCKTADCMTSIAACIYIFKVLFIYAEIRSVRISHDLCKVLSLGWL